MNHCAVGDVRLELQGNDLVITGKQGMTGELWHFIVMYLKAEYGLSW